MTKRKAILVALLVLAALMGRASWSSGPVHADERFTNTCGSSGSGASVSPNYLTYSNSLNIWQAGMHSTCGSHGTWEWELQSAPNGTPGANDGAWSDVINRSGNVIDNAFNDATNCSAGCDYDRDPDAGCSSTKDYRLHLYDAHDDYTMRQNSC